MVWERSPKVLGLIRLKNESFLRVLRIGEIVKDKRGMKKGFCGNRVTLRPLRLSDTEDVYQNIRDEAVAKWTLSIPHPYRKEEAGKCIRRSVYNRRKGLAYDFGIVYRPTGRVIGMIGLANLSRKDQNAEMGYWLGIHYWGQGLMTEAVGLILRFGFQELELHRLSAEVFKATPASGRVLEKSGFIFAGTAREARLKYGQWHDMLKYGLLRQEYPGLGP